MFDKGLFKHIVESDLPESDVEELRNFLMPVRKFEFDTFRLGTKLWRMLPNGDWVEVR